MKGLKLITLGILAITFNINAGIDAHVAEHHSYHFHTLSHSHGEHSHHHDHHVAEEKDADSQNIHEKDHGHTKISLDAFQNIQTRFDFDTSYKTNEFKFKFDHYDIKLKSLIRISDIHYVPPPGMFRNLPLLN